MKNEMRLTIFAAFGVAAALGASVAMMPFELSMVAAVVVAFCASALLAIFVSNKTKLYMDIAGHHQEKNVRINAFLGVGAPAVLFVGSLNFLKNNEASIPLAALVTISLVVVCGMAFSMAASNMELIQQEVAQ